MVPETAPPAPPSFARRRFIESPDEALDGRTGELGRGGADVTAGISEDREDRAK